MAEYIFSGKTFRFPDEPTNERVITVAEIEKRGEGQWWISREIVPEMMRALLDGPHEDIDWMQQSSPKCIKVLKDFFPHLTAKISELVSS